MKTALLVLLFGGFCFGQNVLTARSAPAPLTVEVRTNSSRVRMSDKIFLSAYFRSPDKVLTIWNALWWGGSTGLELVVVDSSGHKSQPPLSPIDPMPPDLTGKDALISLGGRDVFAGFDSWFAASELFPHAGTYTIKCRYKPPLPRNYFKAHTIWGREDGLVESRPISILVEN